MTLFNCIPVSKQIIVLGDFNHNNMDPKNRFIFDTPSENYELLSTLPRDTAVTTDYGSALDIIYTNLKTFNAQTYTTYFRDHSPIYIQALDLEL